MSELLALLACLRILTAMHLPLALRQLKISSQVSLVVLLPAGAFQTVSQSMCLGFIPIAKLII